MDCSKSASHLQNRLTNKRVLMAKKIPDFKNEEEEKAFWKTHDVRDYINWDNAKSFVDRVFKNRKDSEALLNEMKEKIKKR